MSHFFIVLLAILPAINTVPIELPQIGADPVNQEISAGDLWAPSERPLDSGVIVVKPIGQKMKKKRKNRKKKVVTKAPSMLETIPPNQEIVEAKKPKTINGRRSYMQMLMEKNAEYLRTTTTPEPVIYDAANNITYKQEDLREMCTQTRETAEKFGIRDVFSFAEGNCPLIRITYPDVTCEQIGTFVKYCKSIGAI